MITGKSQLKNLVTVTRLTPLNYNLPTVGTGIRNILNSLNKFRNKFFEYKNNFLLDKVFWNERYQCNGSPLNEEFIGHDNSLNHSLTLRNLTWKNFLINGEFLAFEHLEHILGFTLPRVKYGLLKSIYLKLHKKFSEFGSEPIHIEELFRYSKKGSKVFRKIMEYQKTGPSYFRNLTQVKTFCKTTETNFSTDEIWKQNLASWNTHGFPNRFKVFLLKYYNNILGTGNRVVHIDPTKDPSCNFCSQNLNLPAPVESFSHIFFDCPSVNRIIQNFRTKFLVPEFGRTEFFENNFDLDVKKNNVVVMVLNCLRYAIWQIKLNKSALAYYTVETETILLLEIITGSSKKIKNAVINSDLLFLEGNGRDRDRQDGRPP